MTAARCPSDEVLRQLVEDQLDVASAGMIDRHLRECPECVSRLDRLTADPGLPWEALRTPAATHSTAATCQADRHYWKQIGRAHV